MDPRLAVRPSQQAVCLFVSFDLAFLGIPVWTVADGETNEMHWGLKGTMSALFLKTHAIKVRRGHAGRVRAG